MDTYDDFVGARRAVLIEEFGGGAEAVHAVDRALTRCRRAWTRLEQTTDVESHVRDLVSHELERPRRRRLWLAALIVVSLLTAMVVLVSLLPAPPVVRAEVNPVPVPWFAESQLHLAEVVVTLPGAGAFVPVDDGGVVIEDEDDSLLLVEADGDVSDFDGEMPAIAEPEVPAPDTVDDVTDRIDVAVAPTGESVHLMEIAAAGPEAGVYVRLSETINRLFVICLDAGCTSTSRVVIQGRDVRLH